MIKLLLMYPTLLTCELLAATLRDEDDIQVVGYAHSCGEAMKKLEKMNCNMVLASATLSNSDDLEFVQAIRHSFKDIKVLLTDLMKSRAAVLKCLEAGIAGYVLTEDSLADLVKKIRAAHNEELLISPTMAAALMDRVAELKNMLQEFHAVSMNWSEELFAELTPREWEVLKLIEKGFNNQQIAQTLVIEKGTVKNHVHNILNKLDVRSREQAAMLTRQLSTNPDSTDLHVNGEHYNNHVPQFPLHNFVESKFSPSI